MENLNKLKIAVLSISFVLAWCVLVALQPLSAQHSSEPIMNIKITAGNAVLTGQLNNTPASLELLDKLPITLVMRRHDNREYYTQLRLAASGKKQNGYEPGDISYWAPGGAVVLYYAPGYTGSLVKMGRITSGLEQLSRLGQSVSVQIEKVEDEK